MIWTRYSLTHRNTLKDLSTQPKRLLVLCFCLPSFFFISAMLNQQGGKMQESKLVLPKTIML